MKSHLLIASLFLVACGGGKKAPEAPVADPAPQPDPAAEMAKEEPPPAPAPEPAPAPPPPPKVWTAKAELTAVKGQKAKLVAVSFQQEEGGAASIVSDGWYEGLAPGKYHFVVHESADCGPNATKAGKAWPDAAAEITMDVGKDKKGNIDAKGLAVALDGDKSIVGKTLVLHADKKGKPDKAVACGAIAMAGAAAAEPKQP